MVTGLLAAFQIHLAGNPLRSRWKLIYLEDAEGLQDLLAPPGNHLEKLKGIRSGQYSIRINDQWRICFEWAKGNARNVEIVDYHS